MKFACDKCKTRYSIGDDRVRGKILKIRCKNCANVITVREGMDADAGEPARRATGSTIAVPLVAPSALQEEWYVSIDGVQSGPLSLADAQRWVSTKPFEAELHCWNEGFDDWMPVDKVSHFRNLRKPRAPAKTAPPPLPEKPLFAATMAAIEKEASGPNRQKLPPLSGAAPGIASRAKPNGAGSAPSIPAIPASRSSSPSGRFPTAGQPTSGAATVSAPSYPSPAAEPAAPPRGMFDLGDRSSQPGIEQRSVKQALESDDDDDGLSIGEVSRVVKLTDLAPRSKPKPAAGTASVPRIGGATGALSRVSTGLTGASPRMSPSELGMNVDPALAAAAAARAGEPSADESIVARSFAERHRRGLMALIGFSALLVLGVIGAVVFVVSKSADESGRGLGGMKQIDTSRPEDIVRKQLPLPQPGSTHITQQKQRWPSGRPNPTNTAIVEEPTGNSLRASEVEDMAAKQGEGTKRCYMRAQKGAMGFEIAEVKKISVTLTVAKDGSVSDVQLSSHGANSFGQCLIARIKAWRFRASSSGGTFRISLAFSS